MSLKEKVLELENILRKEDLNVTELVCATTRIIGCNIYLSNAQGEIVAYSVPTGDDCPNVIKETTPTLKTDFKQRLGFTFQITANLPLESCIFKEDSCFRPNTFMTIVPIRNSRSVSSHLLLTKPNTPFNDDELILAQTAALVACIFSYENDFTSGSDSDVHNKATAQLVLDSLSFSELKSISNVLNDLNGMEGFLVASKIADRIGISRSVIVNAMRKLESAGVVDSRSLGIKGTYIKVKNHFFLDLLKERVK